MGKIRVGLDPLSEGWNPMSRVALTSNIERVVLKAEFRVVREEVGKEVDEVIGSISRIINFFSVVVVRESDSDWLIDADKMPKRVPTPRILNRIEVPLLSIDEHRANLIEASKLTGRSWSALQPNDQWDGFILQWQSKTLPEGVIHRCASLRIIPIDVLITGVGLEVELSANLIVPEFSGVGEGVLQGWDQQCQRDDD